MPELMRGCGETMSKKYCPALVVMLYTVLEFSHKSICTTTGYPSSAVGNIISRKIGTVKERGHVVRSRWSRYEKNGELVDRIESDYVNGASTYEIQEKYGVNHATVSEWMRERGHHRGKGYVSHSKTVEAYRLARRANRKTDPNEPGGIRRRCRKYGVRYDNGITKKKLIERDGNRCQICGGLCDSTDRRWGRYGALSPSIDHIIALKNGGNHEWSNVQLAHLICNLVKGDKEQTSEVITHAKEQAIAYEQA